MEYEGVMLNQLRQPGRGEIRSECRWSTDPSAPIRLLRSAVLPLQTRFTADASHASANSSRATGFNISQVVDIVKNVHAQDRVADFD